MSYRCVIYCVCASVYCNKSHICSCTHLHKCYSKQLPPSYANTPYDCVAYATSGVESFVAHLSQKSPIRSGSHRLTQTRPMIHCTCVVSVLRCVAHATSGVESLVALLSQKSPVNSGSRQVAQTRPMIHCTCVVFVLRCVAHVWFIAWCVKEPMSFVAHLSQKSPVRSGSRQVVQTRPMISCVVSVLQCVAHTTNGVERAYSIC